MYSLKKVFGIISFGPKHIKIIVADTSNDEFNCLYYKKINYLGYNINYKLNDFDNTESILTNELIKVDKFIGTRVKRYILDIPNLPISMTNQSIKNQNFKSENDIYNYINEHPYYPNAVCIKKQIIGYIVNGQLLTKFPTESSFMVKCINCFINKNIIDEYKKLFTNLLIDKIDFYVNAFAFSNAFSINSDALLIDIYDEHCNLVEYNKNHEIIYTQSIDFGIKWFAKELSDILQIKDEEKMKHLIENIKCLNDNINNPVVVNYFQNKYLKTKQLKFEDFKKICLAIVIKQINNLNLYLADKNFDEIKIHCANKIHELYLLASNLGYLKIRNVNIGICDESIVGLEDEYISYLVYILKDINKRYETNKIMELVSIDPFFSEDISRNQFHKNLMIKLGIQSTKIWAKLGEGD